MTFPWSVDPASQLGDALIHSGSARFAPTAAGALLLVQPVLALGLSAVILAEHPTPLQPLGAAVAMAAVASSNGLFHRRADARGRSSP